jgi:hypothetical protein
MRLDRQQGAFEARKVERFEHLEQDGLVVMMGSGPALVEKPLLDRCERYAARNEPLLCVGPSKGTRDGREFGDRRKFKDLAG